jgi:2-methylaconitate cis-trans-isomerase PrpF
MRGGTSKGPFFRTRDLPSEVTERDEMLIRLMGAGQELEIDGIGGGNPLSSNVAMVETSESGETDVDYLFAQVGVINRVIDTAPNCGNMLVGVAPFAMERGLVAAKDPETVVRIRNVNLNPADLQRFANSAANESGPDRFAKRRQSLKPASIPSAVRMCTAIKRASA